MDLLFTLTSGTMQADANPPSETQDNYETDPFRRQGCWTSLVITIVFKDGENVFLRFQILVLFLGPVDSFQRFVIAEFVA